MMDESKEEIALNNEQAKERGGEPGKGDRGGEDEEEVEDEKGWITRTDNDGMETDGQRARTGEAVRLAVFLRPMSARKAARRDGTSTSFLRSRFPGCRRLGIPIAVRKYVAWLERLLTTKGSKTGLIEEIATKEMRARNRQELKGVRNGDRKVKEGRADGGGG
jgi:hypothetical protein